MILVEPPLPSPLPWGSVEQQGQWSSRNNTQDKYWVEHQWERLAHGGWCHCYSEWKGTLLCPGFKAGLNEDFTFMGAGGLSGNSPWFRDRGPKFEFQLFHSLAARLGQDLVSVFIRWYYERHCHTFESQMGTCFKLFF